MPTAKRTPRRRTAVSDSAETTVQNTAPSTSYGYSSVAPAAPYSISSLLGFVSNNFAIIFLVGLFFIAGFFAGSLWTENNLLRSGKLTGGANGAGAQPAAQAPTEPTGPTPDQLKKAPEVTDEDWTRGNQKAAVTLIEYSDFECPFCARFHPTVQQIIEEYGNKVRFVYRHYPLSFHPNAQKAAEASECVGKQKGQDGFWKFADAIFDENNKAGGKLSPEIITKVAQSTGVNMAAFKTCLDSGEMAEKVNTLAAGGTQAGITGTPGTIILTNDGRAELIPGALPFDQVKVMLEQYL